MTMQKLIIAGGGKVRAITINDNLHENTYIDGDLNKIFGLEFGYEGESVRGIK